jgi:rhodanese-related sulfurtransferase
MTAAAVDFAQISSPDVRRRLRAGREVALVDVREEALFAQGHPLWAANFPLSRLELQAWAGIPRRDTVVVVYSDDAGEQSQRAAETFRALGYSDVRLLAGGLAGWVATGGETFQDVNAPSKAFGELVEAHKRTPSLAAPDVQALIDANTGVVVADARRFEEFRTMSLPQATSVPGGELVLRIRELAPNPSTPVVVNCAGRTRSIIGAQSLINAGLPNPVAALRNGTIGWTLAGLTLEHGATTTAPVTVAADHLAAARDGARAMAAKAGVEFAEPVEVAERETLDDAVRTTYHFDVRSAAEFDAGHLAGFRHAPGGQLVQETDYYAPVRGARVVLADDDGVRAAMTGSWLAQMGWDVIVLVDVPHESFTETGPAPQRSPAPPNTVLVDAATLADWLDRSPPDTVVLDVGGSTQYRAGHIPGAWLVARSQLAAGWATVPPARRYVLTSASGTLARFAAGDVGGLTDATVAALASGTGAWRAAGLPMETGLTRFAAPVIDRYRRPYEGTDVSASAMEAYLQWELGLIKQLERDGTHGFTVV